MVQGWRMGGGWSVGAALHGWNVARSCSIIESFNEQGPDDSGWIKDWDREWVTLVTAVSKGES